MFGMGTGVTLPTESPENLGVALRPVNRESQIVNRRNRLLADNLRFTIFNLLT